MKGKVNEKNNYSFGDHGSDGLLRHAGTVNYGWEDGVGTILGSFGNWPTPPTSRPVIAAGNALCGQPDA